MAGPLPPLPPGFELIPPPPAGFVIQGAEQATAKPQGAGIVANIGAGASRGVYGDILGAPVEFANAGLKLIGLGSERPFGGSEDMRSVADWIAGGRVEPTNEAERIAYSGGRAVGNAAGTMMGGGILAQANNPLAQTVGRALATQPVTQAVSAGVGGVVGEATDNPWLGLASGLGTGVALGVANNVVRGGTAPFREAGRQGIVGGTMRRFAGENADDLAGQIANRGAEPLPGAQRTTAEVTRNAGIANLERTMRNDPQAVATFHNADQARLAAREARVATLGQGMGGPAAGAVIRNSFDDGYNAARQTTNRAYDAVRNSQAAIDPQDAYTAGTQSLQRYFGPGAGDPPVELSQMLGDLRSGNVSLQMLERVMQRASAVARQSTDPRVQSVARDIRAAIGNSIETAAQNGAMPADDAAAVIAARGARAEQGQVFENQFTGRLSGRSPRGGTSAPILDSDIPAQFFGTGKGMPERIQALSRAVGNDLGAMEAVRQYGINDFRRAAYNARGDLQPEAARKWMRDHHAALNAIPGLRDTLNRVMGPVLADVDSARFARDAGRAVGSNTVQNATTATMLDNITGIPLSRIPGVESLYGATIGRVGKVFGTDDAIREAMTQALLDPDYAAMALRMADEAGYVPLLRALGASSAGTGAYGAREALNGNAKSNRPVIRVTP